VKEIATVKKNLELLRSPGKLDVAAFIRFEETYRIQVGSRHWFIQPPHLENARKVDIDELYVTATFVTVPVRKRGESSQLSLGGPERDSARRAAMHGPMSPRC
jgi:hypothetical protein